jgi:hypothetical protein
MISSGDDYPIHQTPEPVSQVFTSDRNFYDRYFFNGYWREGEPCFAATLGVYPNLGIMDAAFCAVVDGVEHCVRASRLLGDDRMDTRVGPVRIEVVKPMSTLRVCVDHEAIKADLVFNARAKVIEEPRFTRRSGPRIVMDSTRLTQHGAYEGTLSVAGRRFDATPSRTWGSRDRSWGIRTVGEREPSGAPATSLPQFFWLWSPCNFDEVCTQFDVNETADGSRWHEFGLLTRAEPSAEPELMRSVDWKIDYRSGTRHAKRAEIILRSASGTEHRIELDVLYNFYMQGLGYLHPKWGHGMYVGPDVSEYESFKLSDADERSPLFQHIEAVCRARMGKREGLGVLEMLIFGPHQKSGFKELFDMHP